MNSFKNFIKRYHLGLVAAAFGLWTLRKNDDSKLNEAAYKANKELYDKLLTQAVEAGEEKPRLEISKMNLTEKNLEDKININTNENTKLTNLATETPDQPLKLWEDGKTTFEEKAQRLKDENVKLSTEREKITTEYNDSIVYNDDFLKEIKELLNKSSFEDYFSWFSEYIDGFNIAQNICLINLSLSYMLLNNLATMIIFIGGDRLIEQFQLEIKYPKLSYFIKKRKKITTISIKFQICWFIIVLFAQFLFNLYGIFHFT